ncbi:manganese and iron superoxide dismutase [Nadsonia fulvescens var. elongata DSM 6958]|uniref:Superoxide dismutase n=1 Tax=Nadsonia fulvescens var. elongata DSM 6958 TaxID=857566 RepID=A0A1E3PEV0_9ASCO|nr:manganese and iron superoxide dismutase [Nadsonia fulvescens var. elongata DSM 6958]
MSFALARNSFARKAAFSAKPAAILARGKATLPDLDYDFGALEPFISGQINEIHYTKHHQTYVNGFNQASEKLAEAQKEGNVRATVELQSLINFHGGGHVNHSLFWKNLAPPSQGGGERLGASSPLTKAIEESFGSYDKIITATNVKLAGVQGSGWAWIVKNTQTNALEVISKPNQDMVGGNYIPIVGIDAWEHAYYLQYQNVKADYFKAIWNVINWKEAEKRFLA